MIILKSEKKQFGLALPTTVGEVKSEMINVAKIVQLPKNYCLLGLCYFQKLTNMAIELGSKSPKGSRVSVKPLMAKIAYEDGETINCHNGDIVIIDKTALERGTHVNLPFSLSYANVLKYLDSDKDLTVSIIKNDIELFDTITQSTMLPSETPEIIVVEFKVVPVVAISASLPFEEFAECDDKFIYRPEPVKE